MASNLYIGTKLVRAKPMTRQAYNDYRRDTVPRNENPAADGYLVEYLDGGKPDMPDRLGYVSWSPKDVFERAYRLAPITFVERAQAELQELDSKSLALQQFFKGSLFPLLSWKERTMLRVQARYMAGYRKTLRLRLRHYQ